MKRLNQISYTSDNQNYQMGGQCQKCLAAQDQIPPRQQFQITNSLQPQNPVSNIKGSKFEDQPEVANRNKTTTIPNGSNKVNQGISQQEGIENSSIYPKNKGLMVANQIKKSQSSSQEDKEQESNNLASSSLYSLAFKSQLKSITPQKVKASHLTLDKNQESKIQPSKIFENPEKQIDVIRNSNPPHKIEEQQQSQPGFQLLNPKIDSEIDIELERTAIKKTTTSAVVPSYQIEKRPIRNPSAV